MKQYKEFIQISSRARKNYVLGEDKEENEALFAIKT